MDKKYTISKEYLEKILSKGASSLVGMVMKRFEIHDNKEVIKKEAKELIYETFRSVKAHIESFSTGVKFISKTRKQD